MNWIYSVHLETSAKDLNAGGWSQRSSMSFKTFLCKQMSAGIAHRDCMRPRNVELCIKASFLEIEKSSISKIPRVRSRSCQWTSYEEIHKILQQHVSNWGKKQWKAAKAKRTYVTHLVTCSWERWAGALPKNCQVAAILIARVWRK